MTAAFADDEYEVPPHGGAPAEIVERVEHGNVVYLTRHGERVAAVVPPDRAEASTGQDWTAKLRQIAEDPTVAPALRARAQSQMQQIQALIEAVGAIEEDVEDIAIGAERLGAIRAGTPTIPHDEIERMYT